MTRVNRAQSRPPGPPDVSVLMTVYNNALYLEETLAAVLAQKDCSFELIAVDDGSSDDSPAILRRYAENDPRFRVVRQLNGGFGGVSALNHGLRLARGKYIARCDADDVWLQGKLALQIAFMRKNPHYLATFTHAICIDQKGAPCPPPFEGCFLGEGQGEALAHRLLCGNFLCHSTAVYLAEAAQRVGPLSNNHHRSTDHDFWLRMASIGDLAIIERAYTRYRIHDQNLSFKSVQESQRDAWKVIVQNIKPIHDRWPLSRQNQVECFRTVAHAAGAAHDWAAAAYFFSQLQKIAVLSGIDLQVQAQCHRLMAHSSSLGGHEQP